MPASHIQILNIQRMFLDELADAISLMLVSILPIPSHPAAVVLPTSEVSSAQIELAVQASLRPPREAELRA
jgi:hypothetical protein